MSDDNWLDDVAPPAAEIARIEARPEYARLLTALKPLSRKQQLLVREAVEAGFEGDLMRKAVRDKHNLRIRRETLDAWMAEPDFANAMETMQEFANRALAISKAGLISKVRRGVNVCGEVIPEFRDKQGNVHPRLVDAGAYFAGLALLSKMTGILAEAADRPAPARQLPQLVVQIVGNATVRTSEIIDAEIIEERNP